MTVGGQGAKLFYLSGVIHGEYQKTEVRILYCSVAWCPTPVCFVYDNKLNFVLVYVLFKIFRSHSQ
jgi:hypothetical protein